MSLQNTLNSVIAVVFAATLAACSFDSPSRVSQAGPEVYKDEFTIEENTAAIGPGTYQGIAKEYYAKGDSPALVTVMYDPRSSVNTARHAADAAQRISSELRKRGVRDVQPETLPVQNSGDVSRTVISFNTVNARPPSECGDPLGKKYTEVDSMDNYQVGCTLDTYLAKQVARPKDLLGNNDQDLGEGRRSANALETYMDGAPNAELDGEYASEN